MLQSCASHPFNSRFGGIDGPADGVVCAVQQPSKLCQWWIRDAYALIERSGCCAGTPLEYPELQRVHASFSSPALRSRQQVGRLLRF
jgi:hypothetical protein